MSSMFKKKGGLAFKPKIPSSRPRQPTRPAAAPTPASQPAKSVDSQIAPEPIQEENKQKEPEVTPTPDIPNNAEATSESLSAGQTPAESETSNAAPTEPIPSATTDKSIEPESIDTPSETSQVAPPIEKPQETPGRGKRARATDPTPQLELQTEAQPRPIEPSTETTVHEDHTPSQEITSPAPETEPSQEATPSQSQSEETPGPQPAKRKPRAKRTAATKTTDATEDGTATAARPKKRQKRATQSDGTEPETRPRTRRSRATSDSAPKSRRARSVTPEDAEEQQVDLQTLKMSDLTKDLRIGKKFSRHDELRERERQNRVKGKVDKDSEAGEEDGGQTPGPSNGKMAAPVPKPSMNETSSAAGPQFRIVDGQIVVDQSSLVMDRHAAAAASRDDMETIEENDFTRLITSSSFMNTSKLKGPNLWTPSETELFYRGLRMFGTDFEMISKMFAGKQRRHIKLKYNREERHNPRLIDAALIGEKTIKMDIDEYKAATGTEFESVESIEAEQRRKEEEFEAERQRIADEQAEAMRKKREELFADDDSKVAGAKKKKKKGKNDDPNRYGDLVEVEEG